MGEHRKTLQIAQDVLACARHVKGELPQQAILAMAIIGRLHTKIGDYAAAEKWCRDATQMARRKLGEDHSWTAELTGNLGTVYLRQGRYDEAQVILQDAHDKTRRVFGDARNTYRVLENLIRVHVGQGQFDKGLDLRDELQTAHFRWLAAREKGMLQADEAVSPRGSMSYDVQSNTYTIESVGIGVGDVFDEFHFVHKTLYGDGAIRIKIDSAQWIARWTQVGVMMRDGVGSTSKHASVFVGPGGVIDVQYRRTARGPTHSERMCVRDMKLPSWIMLQRQGDNFTAYYSSDGSVWSEVRRDDPNEPLSVAVVMGETALVGLAVTSSDTVRTAEARISNVSITGQVSPEGPFTVSEDISLLTALSQADESN
jgi:hypothetical protein